jgi:hypothetical protein
MKLYTIYALLFFSIYTKLSNAMDLRSVDDHCNYIVDRDGLAPTYRTALLTWLSIFAATSAHNLEIAKSLENAIMLFGNGRIGQEIYNSYNFNYTSFKKNRDDFLEYIKNLEAHAFVARNSELEFYDINYALYGIIGFYAHKSTGGDS